MIAQVQVKQKVLIHTKGVMIVSSGAAEKLKTGLGKLDKNADVKTVIM